MDKEKGVELWVNQGEEQKFCGKIQQTYGLQQSDQIHTLVCNVDGDSIKLRKTEQILGIYEVVVTGKGTKMS